MGLTAIRLLVLGILMLGGASAAFADDYRFDLATHPRTDLTVPTRPGTVVVTVAHRLPDSRYRYSVQRIPVLVPPLPLPKAVEVLERLVVPGPCADLAHAYNTLGTPETEPEVGAKATKAEALLKATSCGTDDATYKEIVAELAVYRSTGLIGTFQVLEGESLVIIVERLSKEDAVEQRWTTTLATGSRGQFLTTYGFSFVGDGDERVFAVPTSETGKFKVTLAPDSEEFRMKAIPAVFFQWLPASQQRRDFSLSPFTAGLGATADGFGVFVGGSALYNHNLGVVVGLALTHQRRLSPKYTDGSVIGENLTEDQLSEEVIRPSLFFALTFRFGANPFERKDTP